MSPEFQLIPFEQTDLNKAFALYKTGLFEVIETAFGWDEDYQRQRFSTRYPLEWFHWIINAHQRVGYLCFHKPKDEIHISLLMISSEFQRKAFGRQVMNGIHSLAKAESRTVRLSSFKNNGNALSFYQRLGYRIVGQDEFFYDMVWEPQTGDTD